MSEYFLFTVYLIYANFRNVVDFTNYDEAWEFFERQRPSKGIKRIDLIGCSAIYGVVTIASKRYSEN